MSENTPESPAGQTQTFNGVFEQVADIALAEALTLQADLADQLAALTGQLPAVAGSDARIAVSRARGLVDQLRTTLVYLGQYYGWLTLPAAEVQPRDRLLADLQDGQVYAGRPRVRTVSTVTAITTLYHEAGRISVHADTPVLVDRGGAGGQPATPLPPAPEPEPEPLGQLPPATSDPDAHLGDQGWGITGEETAGRHHPLPVDMDHDSNGRRLSTGPWFVPVPVGAL